MKKQELELVAHEILPGLRMYVTQLKYCELHLHIDAELCLVLDGRGKLHTIQKDTQIKRGEFFYFNSLEAHEVTAASDKILIFGVQYSPVILNICDPKLTRLRVNEMTPSASLKKAGVYDKIVGLMLEAGIAYFKKENLFALHCMSLINEMLYLFFNHVPATDFRSTTSQSYKLRMERLKRLLTYIDERYTERLTIAELAQTEHLSVSRLSHFFQEMLQMPFQTYLAQKRFSRACELLADPACTVTRAAEESGFSSTRYLNQMMEEHLHMSAMEYHHVHKGNLGALHSPGRQDYMCTAAESRGLLERYAAGKTDLLCLLE